MSSILVAASSAACCSRPLCACVSVSFSMAKSSACFAASFAAAADELSKAAAWSALIFSISSACACFISAIYTPFADSAFLDADAILASYLSCTCTIFSCTFTLKVVMVSSFSAATLTSFRMIISSSNECVCGSPVDSSSHSDAVTFILAI